MKRLHTWVALFILTGVSGLSVLEYRTTDDCERARTVIEKNLEAFGLRRPGGFLVGPSNSYRTWCQP